MDLFECQECGESYYKKVDECHYCEGKEFDKSDGTEREVILTVLYEITLESGEYEQFTWDELEELVDKKLGKECDYIPLSNAIDDAVKKEYFSKMTLYISKA